MVDRPRPRLASVRARTTLAVTAAVAVVLIVGALFIVHEQRDALRESVEESAELRADGVAAALDDGTVTDEIETPEELDSVIQVIDERGRVYQSSENADEGPVFGHLQLGDRDTAQWTVHIPEVDDAEFLVVGRRADMNDRDFVVYAALSLDSIDDETQELVHILAIGVPLFVVLAAALTWFVVGRALRPVDAIRAEVDAIGARDLHRRVPEPRTGDEIDRLARTMNAMLERVEIASERQRRFVADASHELRSPLTSIRAQLEVGLTHPERVERDAEQRALLDETMRLQRLVDDLLVLATADEPTSAPSHEIVDLDDVVLAEVRRLRVRGAVQIDAHGVSAAQVEGDRDALTRVVRNLLDNAERYAASTVIVAVRENHQNAELVVRDDGPGIPEELRIRVFERFTRADDARARTTGGAGLGLAIAHAIVVAHGGRIAISDQGPGAAFVVQLPLATT
jgi:signal transduction histidine kinase